LQRPEWAGNFDVSAIFGSLLVQYNMQFMDEQALRAVEIETVDTLYGPAGIADATQIHNISAAWDLNDSYTVYGGINNITDERPFITEFAFPVSPQGQFLFVGLEMNFL
jgi:outer membrane receptor protein involved in Fe transport